MARDPAAGKTAAELIDPAMVSTRAVPVAVAPAEATPVVMAAVVITAAMAAPKSESSGC
jgi:hypothetical protein